MTVCVISAEKITMQWEIYNGRKCACLTFLAESTPLFAQGSEKVTENEKRLLEGNKGCHITPARDHKPLISSTHQMH